MLHKAKLLGDAVHAINKAAKEAADVRTRGEKKRKMVAAAPEWLKDRVERGEELPSIEINSGSETRNGHEEMMIADVMEYATGGELPREVFVDLMG